jgi:DivIVA domain-containing protein
MLDDQPTESFSILGFDRPTFDLVMRGYDRRQVDEHIDRLDSEVREATEARASATERSADMAAQLASTFAEVESLRQRLRSAVSTPGTTNVSDRIRSMFELAEEEAAQIRAAAIEVRESIDAELASVRETAQQQADDVLAQARAEAEQVTAAARAEAQRLTTQAQAKLEAAESTYQASMATADAEAAELLAAAKAERDSAHAAAEAELAKAHEEATAHHDRVSVEVTGVRAQHDADMDRERTTHAETVATWTAARDKLDQDAALKRKTAEEDFEIILRMRRTEELARSIEIVEQAASDAARIAKESEEQAKATVEAAHAEAATFLDGAREELDTVQRRRAITVNELGWARDEIDRILEELGGGTSA